VLVSPLYCTLIERSIREHVPLITITRSVYPLKELRVTLDCEVLRVVVDIGTYVLGIVIL
jgi:hypothetical protein